MRFTLVLCCLVGMASHASGQSPCFSKGAVVCALDRRDAPDSVLKADLARRSLSSDVFAALVRGSTLEFQRTVLRGISSAIRADGSGRRAYQLVVTDSGSSVTPSIELWRRGARFATSALPLDADSVAAVVPTLLAPIFTELRRLDAVDDSLATIKRRLAELDREFDSLQRVRTAAKRELDSLHTQGCANYREQLEAEQLFQRYARTGEVAPRLRTILAGYGIPLPSDATIARWTPAQRDSSRLSITRSNRRLRPPPNCR